MRFTPTMRAVGRKRSRVVSAAQAFRGLLSTFTRALDMNRTFGPHDEFEVLNARAARSSKDGWS